MKDSNNKRFENSFKTSLMKHPKVDEEVKEVLDLVRITDKNSSQHSVGLSMHSLPLSFDLKFKLLDNKTTLSFWTSDNPSVLYNQFLERKRPHLNNTGLVTKGLQTFCPLSPKKCLVFYDSGTYEVGNKSLNVVEINQRNDVEQLNKLQFMSAVEKIYFNQSFDEPYLQSFSHKFLCEKEIKQLDFKCEILKESANEIIQRKSMPEVRSNLELSFIKILKKARSYQVADNVHLPRNREVFLLAKELHKTFLENSKGN